MTLKDLFISKGEYIIEIDINSKYFLFCEGLTENGCTNTALEFNVNNIKKINLELIEKETGESARSIDVYGIDLTETLESIREKTLNLIGSDANNIVWEP
jgi:hypothetical protein